MDGQESDLSTGHLGHGPLHGFADIVKLEIQENLLSFRAELSHKRHSSRSVKLHANFVEIDCRTEPRDQRPGLLFVLKIKCDDDRICVHKWCRRSFFVVCIPLHQKIRIALLPCSLTRPTRYAPANDFSNAAASLSGNDISKPPEVCGSYSSSSNSDCPSTLAEANSRLFLSPPGIAPCRA